MFQKLVPFIACIALVRGVPLAAPVHLHTGSSIQTRSQDNLGNYQFGYNIVDELGATNGRQETGDAYGNKVGSYHLADIDGRVRRVDYVADDYGFRASIKTNEPGTAPADAANAAYLSSAPIHAPAHLAVAPAHAPLVHAPAPLIHAPVHAPLVHAPAHAPLIHAPAHLAVAHAAPLAYPAYAPAKLLAAPTVHLAAAPLAAPLLAHGHLAHGHLAHGHLAHGHLAHGHLAYH